jgi:hypothetical protein
MRAWKSTECSSEWLQPKDHDQEQQPCVVGKAYKRD